MPCEMCGKESERYLKVSLEGSMLSVCFNCSKYGKKINAPKRRFKSNKPLVQEGETELVLVPNFHEIIEKARQNKNIKQEDFAKQLNEKESLIHQIETGHINPSNSLAKKIEKHLGIKILEEIEENLDIEEKLPKQDNLSSDTLTIGDLIKSKMKKNE